MPIDLFPSDFHGQIRKENVSRPGFLFSNILKQLTFNRLNLTDVSSHLLTCCCFFSYDPSQKHHNKDLKYWYGFLLEILAFCKSPKVLFLQLSPLDVAIGDAPASSCPDELQVYKKPVRTPLQRCCWLSA